MSFDKTIDTDVDFKYGQPNFIESDQCYEYDYQCDEYGNYCEELEQQCYNHQNGNGLMLREGTQSDEYPIVYYRGNVNNNNVIYAGYCWLIVRTTETGGIKLVYNGEVNNGGSCNNYSGVNGENKVDSAFITESIFNTGYNTPLSIGYMYNDDENLNYNISSSNDNLSLFVESYLSHLSDKMIDSETGRHVQNLKDSVIKEKIDEWYILNVYETEYEDLLEDTIWCNDRSVTDPIYSIENYEANRTFYFSAYNRLGAARYDDTLEVTPILTCSRDMDKFTVDSENGNGDLDYPIGLLTADEIILAEVADYSGIVKHIINFLSDDTYWTLSPWMFHQSYFTTIATAGSQISNNRPDAHHSTLGVKPSISLKNSTVLANGTGTFENPYILAY